MLAHQLRAIPDFEHFLSELPSVFAWLSGEHRAYRLDRIQSAHVTTQPFTPRYAIEFPESGAIPARPSAWRSAKPFSYSGRSRLKSSETRYVVTCPRCGKRFRRKRRGTKLRPHRDPTGAWNCPARRGTVELTG